MKRKIGQKLSLNKVTISNLGIDEKRAIRGGAVDTTGTIGVDPNITKVATCAPCSTAYTYFGQNTCIRTACMEPLPTNIER